MSKKSKPESRRGGVLTSKRQKPAKAGGAGTLGDRSLARGKMARAFSGGAFAAGLDGLAAWFECKQRVLPWRDEPTLYRVWISEIMLQQTQVITVVPYFERFTSRFPTLESLAEAPLEDVVKQWAGLGYYSRARNLHKAARQIVGQGGFPRDREGWLEIPGVGDYTAGAILSIALDQPEAILDGNVERVLSRVRRVSRVHGDASYKERLWRLSRAFVGRAHERGLRPRVINQALMELGATTCTPRKPLCVFCPLKDLCRAFAAGEQEAYPPRKKPKQWLQVREELHGIFDSQGRVLLRLRQPGEWRAGLWDLPSDPPRGLSAKSSERRGTVESRHVVTRHKITRSTQVWQLSSSSLLSAAESGTNSEAELASATAESRVSGARRNTAFGAQDRVGPDAQGRTDPGAQVYRWVSLSDPEVAVGSALKKTLQLIQERFEIGRSGR